MTHLVPCPGCGRHVRVTESACPFCNVGLSLANTPPPVLPTIRLGRAATFAFGATLLGATAIVGCGGESEERDGGGKGASGSSSGGSSNGGSSSGGSSSGGSSNGGSAGTSAGGVSGSQNTGGDAGIAQPYG